MRANIHKLVVLLCIWRPRALCRFCSESQTNLTSHGPPLPTRPEASILHGRNRGNLADHAFRVQTCEDANIIFRYLSEQFVFESPFGHAWQMNVIDVSCLKQLMSNMT